MRVFMGYVTHHHDYMERTPFVCDGGGGTHSALRQPALSYACLSTWPDVDVTCVCVYTRFSVYLLDKHSHACTHRVDIYDIIHQTMCDRPKSRQRACKHAPSVWANSRECAATAHIVSQRTREHVTVTPGVVMRACMRAFRILHTHTRWRNHARELCGLFAPADMSECPAMTV